ncbi:uncharacterized protein LOC133917679 [Phragmites australis]|uniref:uncharacterized protein LOC133917679 n=1 Tax=Phragmites australis TaxID=29695 RepID=UPI002D7800FE|nr:uncharacterized protein LOC133917679 [Phragmites australis]
MAASTTTPTMPATVTPLPGYGYQGSAAGAGAGVATVPAAHSSGSIGTFFAVLTAVLVLTLLSCVFGRVCAGQAEGPEERYDCARLARRWRAPRRTDRREAKPPPVGEVPAALPLPEEP